MRIRSRWLALLLLGAPLLALAQAASNEPESFDLRRVLYNFQVFNVVIVVGVYAGLFKVLSLQPHAERWLVAAALIALPPVAVYLLRWQIYTPGLPAYPIRDSGVFWAVIAGLLAVGWWLLKTKTSWLDPGALSVNSPEPARERNSAPAETPEPSKRAEVTPPTMIRTSADPERARTTPRTPEPPARAATDSIFISYRRQDSADVTGRIYDRLIQRFDRKQIFKDVDSIPLGVDFRSHLGDVVGRCDLLLAIIGPQWLAVAGPNGRRLDDVSDFVRIEIEAALARNIPVIPVLVGGAELPPESVLPPSLAPLTFRNGIAVRPDPDFHRDMDRLITGLESHHRA